MSEEKQKVPLVTFSLESWEQYYNDEAREGLWAAHYGELAQPSMPFGPDVPYFRFLDANGMLHLLTARHAGTMIGYCLLAVKRHPHYSALCAFEDSYYINKAYRGNALGSKMVEEANKGLKARGVKRVYFMDSGLKPLGMMFASLGFTPSHSCYSKEL